MSKNKKPRTATNLMSNAENIMTYTLEGLLPKEIEPLFTALFLSPSEETVNIVNRYPDNSDIRYIASEVILYHKDAALLARGVSNGFFEYEVAYLLKIAKANRIAGARFAQLFCNALSCAVTLGLSNALQDDIAKFLDYQKNLDGFLIIDTSEGKFVIYFAKDVIPA